MADVSYLTIDHARCRSYYYDSDTGLPAAASVVFAGVQK